MPLYELACERAVENRRTNPVRGWPSRTGSNRIEPVCTPAFDVPFQLQAGEAIFTVGSCFARNVEQELLSRGFELPMRDVFRRPEFQKMDASAVNNFGTPSIRNELAWAFGEAEFDEDAHIVEVASDRWADMHLLASIRPDRRPVVVERRLAITEAYRAVARSRVVIMTLGYVEVWLDTHSGFYLNVAPRPGIIRRFPDRFRLHVMSFEEVHRHLDEAVEIIRRHGRDDVQVLLTVSPVPIDVTHRDCDVVVANTYSKSVLRAAAETVCAQHDFVTYFPSYESIMLSDRRIAWRDDQVHVTQEIVTLNVGRMIDAFVGSTDDPEALAAEIERGGLPVALEKARTLPSRSPVDADAFFETFGSRFAGSREFVVLHADHLTERGQAQQSLALLDAVPEDERKSLEVMGAVARAHLADGAPERAYEIYLGVIERRLDTSQNMHSKLLAAAEACDDFGKLQVAIARIASLRPGLLARSLVRVGRWHLRRGEVERAGETFEEAIAQDPTLPSAQLGRVQVLLTSGQRDRARTQFETIEATTPTDIRTAERLRQQLL